MRLFAAILLVVLLLFASFGCQPQFKGGDFVDDLGREVTITQPPQRIVSHVPGITEILFALDLGDKVVGVSDFCNYPEAATQKEKVGGYYDPSVEKIVALQPDIVFTDGYVDYLMLQLDQLQIPYVVLRPQDVPGVLKNIELVGKIAGVEKKAVELASDLQKRIETVAGKVKDAPRLRVFYTFASIDLANPWTAGPGSFADSLITMAGGENIGAKAPAPWVQFSIEELVSSDPEIIIVDTAMGTDITPIEQLKTEPAWRDLTAVKEGKVFRVDGDLVNRNGPRIVDGLEAMAQAIHPERF